MMMLCFWDNLELCKLDRITWSEGCYISFGKTGPDKKDGQDHVDSSSVEQLWLDSSGLLWMDGPLVGLICSGRDYCKLVAQVWSYCLEEPFEFPSTESVM